MSPQKKTTSAAHKAPKKLIPRTAPKTEVTLPEVAAVAEVAAPVIAPAETPATASAAKVIPAAKTAKNPAKKPAAKVVEANPAAVEEAKPVAEIKQPLGKPAKVSKAPKAEKPVKARKIKLVRDSYAMPEAEYAQINVLKKRLAGQNQEVKKSELLRAGIAVLCALNDAELASVMSHVERIKTGRPGK